MGNMYASGTCILKMLQLNRLNQGFFQERPSLNDEWIWKIPQAEIDANPFISEADQN